MYQISYTCYYSFQITIRMSQCMVDDCNINQIRNSSKGVSVLLYKVEIKVLDHTEKQNSIKQINQQTTAQLQRFFDGKLKFGFKSTEKRSFGRMMIWLISQYPTFIRINTMKELFLEDIPLHMHKTGLPEGCCGMVFVEGCYIDYYITYLCSLQHPLTDSFLPFGLYVSHLWQRPIRNTLCSICSSIFFSIAKYRMKRKLKFLLYSLD